MHYSIEQVWNPIQQQKQHASTNTERAANISKKARYCPICGKKLKRKVDKGEEAIAHTDHCHISDEYRGIICVGCNLTLGRFKDQIPDLLEAGLINHAKYLENHRNKSIWWLKARKWGFEQDLLAAYKI